MSDDRLLTDSDVGKMLQLPPGRVLKLARRGEIPSVVLPGDEIRFLRADLTDWLSKCKRPAGQEGKPCQ